MTDTQWADISEFQVPVNDTYPHDFICIRSNDGNHIDNHIQGNLSWCKSRRASGKLWGFMVYYFYRPGVDGAKNLMAQVGTPDPRMAVMIDVEAAGGQVSGDQSAAINAQYHELTSWLGDARRVVGYGNTSDLGTLWRSKPSGLRLVIAAYGTNPGYPGKFAHQFTDSGSCAPFGTCDMNSADGMSRQDLQSMFGFSGSRQDLAASDGLAGLGSYRGRQLRHPVAVRLPQVPAGEGAVGRRKGRPEDLAGELGRAADLTNLLLFGLTGR